MIKEFQTLINNAENIVFFGGAGVSTESGIPDFRSIDGLYSQKYKYPPEEILSYEFFMSRPKEFYEFYNAKILAYDAAPNAAHLKLAELENAGKLTGIVTQNIDGLHHKAGSKNVCELHGTIYENYCMTCNKSYDVNYIKEHEVPYCECGGLIKPKVVLYGESLDDKVVEAATSMLSKADLLIIGGTSLNVYPAAALIKYYTQENLVLINKGSTFIDSTATLVFNENIGSVLGQIQVNK